MPLMTTTNKMNSFDKTTVWLVGLVLFFFIGLPLIVVGAIGVAYAIAGPR